jgi:hypothetical protein
MKNIHLLPTDKPSKKGDIVVWNGLKIWDGIGKPPHHNQNIYITNDEEIKEGDNVILKSGRLTKAEISQGVLGFKTIDGVAFLYFQEGDKKIILTTDGDLIKDGVQAIDDEFLDWFVNNSSCEFVEIKKGSYELSPMEEMLEKEYVPKGTFDTYKIIIPQEEPEQETLEEAAENQLRKQDWDTTITLPFNGGYIEGFQQGAKWQAERMYSEEEVISLIQFLSMNENFMDYTSVSKDAAKYYLEHFKKK